MHLRCKILILALLAFTGAYCQTKPANVYRSSPAVTVNDARLKVQLNLGIPVVADTAHGLNGGLDSLGLIIQIRSTGAQYKRDTMPGGHKWSLIGGGGVGDTTALMRKGNNLSDVTSPDTSRANLGIKSAALKDTAAGGGNAGLYQVVLGHDTRLSPILTIIQKPAGDSLKINTGSPAFLPLADTNNAGALSPGQKRQLDTLALNLDTISLSRHLDSIFMTIKFYNHAAVTTFQFLDSVYGVGDMLKSIYDINNNGVVDNSENLNGQPGTYYLNRANHTGTQSWASISTGSLPTTLGGYGITDAVPKTRLITIQGQQFDLSADRSFTVPYLKSTTRDTIAKTSHGFTLLEAVSLQAAGWAAADTLHWADGIVSSVIDANHFEVTYNGTFSAPSHGKTVGTNYFLAAAGGGATSSTSPIKSQALYKPIDANNITVNVTRPFDFSASFGGSGTGSGTVTSFSAVDITNFASQAITNASSTPQLTYTPLNAGAHKFWGNNTGSSAVPNYYQPAAADLSASGYSGGGTKVLLDNNTWGSYSSGSGVPTTVQRTVSQTAHGFSVLTDVYVNSSGNYAKADTLNWPVAVVDTVIDANTFRVTFQGLANVPSHGKTVGSYYYATGTIGTTSTISPTKSMPVYMPIDANTVLITIRRPFDFSAVVQVNSWNGRTGNVTPAASDYSFSQISGTVADGQLSSNIPKLASANNWLMRQTYPAGSVTSPGFNLAGTSAGFYTLNGNFSITDGFANVVTFASSGLYLGNGAGPSSVYGFYATGTNTPGQDFGLYANAGTGSASGGNFKVYTSPAGAAGTQNNAYALRFQINGQSGQPTFPYLAGTGTRMLVADGSGNISAQAIPSGGSGTLTSFNGRTVAAVVPTTGDYTAAMVTNAVDQTQTYNNPAWLNTIGVAKVTGLAEVGITGNFSDLVSHPTTLGAYGITDAFPLAGGRLAGTAGAGYVGFPNQSANPGTPADGINIFSNAANSFSFKGVNGKVNTFSASNTADRTYTLPDLSDAIVTEMNVETLTQKTLTSPQINFGSDAAGDLIVRNGSGNSSRLPAGAVNQVLTVTSAGQLGYTTPASVPAGGLASGVYTPTVANISNAANILVRPFYYIRIGNIVNVTGAVQMTVPALGNTYTISITLPPGASSTVSSGNDLEGTAVSAVDWYNTGTLAAVNSSGTMIAYLYMLPSVNNIGNIGPISINFSYIVH